MLNPVRRIRGLQKRKNGRDLLWLEQEVMLEMVYVEERVQEVN